jgi:hypothetical protein
MDWHDVSVPPGKWSLGDDNAQNHAPPTTADDVVFTGSSGDVTLDAKAECASFDASAYTGEFDSATFDFDVGGDFKFNVGGTWTNAANCTLTLTAGNSGDIENPLFSNAVGEMLVAAGAAFRLTDNVFAKKVTATGDITRSAAEALFIVNASAAWWGAQSGTVACDLDVFRTIVAPGNNITLVDGCEVIFRTNAAHTITLNADINVGSSGTLRVQNTSTGDTMIVITGTGSITAGTVLLDSYNDGGSTARIVLDGGTHNIGQIQGHDDDNGSNEVYLGTCRINSMVAGIDGAKLDVVLGADPDNSDVATLVGDGTSTLTDFAMTNGTIRARRFDKANSNATEGTAGTLRFLLPASGTSTSTSTAV